MSRVLIVHPDFSRLGGIEIYIRKIVESLDVPHDCFSIAQRAGEKGMFGKIARIIKDYRDFWSVLGDKDIDVVHLNPSLATKSFFREGLFHLIAKMRGKRTLVFFHGWSVPFEKRLDRQNGWLFRLFYGRADTFVVLAKSFEQALRKWGLNQPVYNETTVISDSATEGFDIDQAIESRLSDPKWRIVFAARITQTKGIDTAIEALNEVRESHPHLELLVAGDGDYSEQARNLANQIGANNVTFLGSISLAEIYDLLRKSHIMLLPTQHDEGFPNIVVEAMSFGLAIVTRPVGGIPDFFKPGTHGYLSESTQPEDFAQLLKQVADDRSNFRNIAKENYDYAMRHFLVSKAAARISNMYNEIRATS